MEVVSPLPLIHPHPPTPFPSVMATMAMSRMAASPVKNEPFELMVVETSPSTRQVFPSLLLMMRCMEQVAPKNLLHNLPCTLLGLDSNSQRLPSGTTNRGGILTLSDSETIAELMLPPRRKLPPPPLVLRPDKYEEARSKLEREVNREEGEEGEDSDSDLEGQPRCFEPHIITMTRDRMLYPFIEVSRPGPRTNKSIPVMNRTYYPYADQDVHYNIVRTEMLIVVNLQNLTLADPKVRIPSGQMGVFSVLAPRNAPHGLVYPGIIWPDQFRPINFPLITAHTLGQRYEPLLSAKKVILLTVSVTEVKCI